MEFECGGTLTQQRYPEPPEDFMGSRPEWAAHWALTRLGVVFNFQSSFMGGRLFRGGVIVDFEIPDLSLAINIQSTYWHYGSSAKIASDKAQRIALEGQGLTVIWIQEEDILRNPLFYIREALQLIEHTPAFV